MTGKRLFFTFLSVIIFAFTMNAQSISIKGTVEDTAKAPVAGATVVLRNERTGLERTVSTDANGHFEFTGAANDKYEVIAVAGGFARASVTVDGGTNNVALTLEPAMLREEVTVISGSRQEELRESLSTKVDVLTRNDLKTTGYETVGEALREVPGVLTRRSSETSAPIGEQVQGIDSRQVLVLMDGQPVTGARGVKSGIINLDRQQVTQLESVEVVKGAASALYGSDAIGGVVNLRTRDQVSPLNGTLTASGGSFGAVDLSGIGGFVKNGFSGIASVGRHKNNGYDLFPSDFTTDGSGYHRYDTYGKLKYQFNDKFSLLGFVDSYWNNARGRVVGEPSVGNSNGRQINNVDDDSQNYGLTADWAIDGKTNLQARGYFSRYDEIYRSTTQAGVALPDGNLFERYGKFDVSVTRVLGDRNLLQGGAEFTTNRYKGIARLQNDVGTANTQVVWLQDKINLHKRVTLTLGGRFDHHSEFGNAFSPKVALNVKISDNIVARASWGRGFRAPDLGQLFYNFRNALFAYQVLGNKNLVPEHSGSWQVGGEFTGFGRKARLGLNFFRNDVRNLINSVNLGTISPDGDPTTIAGEQAQVATLLRNAGADPSSAVYVTAFPTMVFAYLNTANVYTQGIEADGSYILPYGFSASGAYTFLEAIDKANGRTLTGRHKHHGFMKLAYANAEHGVNINFRGTFFGKWWATSTRKAAAFRLFDLYGAKELPKGFELYATIDNIFNSQDVNTGKGNTATPSAALALDRADVGRTFRVGVRWSFDRKR